MRGGGEEEEGLFKGEGEGEEEGGHLAVCCAFTVSPRVHDIRTCIHTCMHAYMHAYIHTYIHTYIHK